MLPEIPKEYFEYIKAHGAFEGFTTDDSEPGFIELWAPEAIAPNNRDIEIESLAPGFIAFAGNGGGEVLAFDASGAIHMLPLIGIELDCAIKVADDFASLVGRFVR